MARFTVSDCTDSIENRFEMTLAASVRARQIEEGSESFLTDEENDKPTVLALRELAGNHYNGAILQYVE